MQTVLKQHHFITNRYEINYVLYHSVHISTYLKITSHPVMSTLPTMIGALVYVFCMFCLMFADDAILISETAEGLQLAIDKIKEYSDNWLLKINSEKTKQNRQIVKR